MTRTLLVPNLRIVGLVCVMVLGCGRTPEPATPGDAQTAAREKADERLRKAVQLATVHLKFHEYAQAEQQLESALTDPAVSETSEALALLERVKTEKREAANQDLAAAPKPPARDTAVPSVAPVPASSTPMPPKQDEAPTVAGTDSPPDAPKVRPAPEPLPMNVPMEPVVDAQAPAAPNPAIRIIADAPAKPVKKSPATDDELSELEANARSQYEASAAFQLYQVFEREHELTEVQQKKFAPLFEKWKSNAEKGLVRNGTTWVAADVAQKAAEQADELISQAVELIKLGNFKEAREVLEKASRIDQNGIRADFMLGMLNSGVGANHPPTADEHFRRVLNRSPRHISALNNLALTEIKEGKFAPALAHFTQATELAPKTPEVNQNLGRLIKEASAKRLSVPDSLLSKFSKLYSERTAAGTVQPSNPSIGWLYMPLYLPEIEKQGRGQAKTNQNGQLMLTGGGTGFLVHPGYLLTNRHVVSDEDFGVADAVRIVDPTDAQHQRELTASVVAISKTHDLALLRCDGVAAAPVRLSTEIPRRGTDVLALGYPKFDLIGRGLKATRGIVTGLPEAANHEMLMFDVEVNSGNSGGPVLDKTGAAVAVATVRYNGNKVGNYSGGVPTATAIPFVKQVIPEYEVAGAGAELNWPDVDELVAPSTVMVLCYYRTLTLRLNSSAPGSPARETRTALQDRSCSVCNAKTKVRCPNPKCLAGIVQTRREFFVTVGEGSMRTRVRRFELVKEPCPACQGNGQVDCGACRDGNDPDLR